MNICLLGSTGFVGQTVMKKLSEKHNVLGISSKQEFGEGSFTGTDMIVNCAGVAAQWFATKHFAEAYTVEQKIQNRIYRIKSESPYAGIVHISSICAVENTCYGHLKLWAEQGILDYWIDPYILRLGGLVGPGLWKNVIYDFVNEKPIRIFPESMCNYISTKEVANIISFLVEEHEKVPLGLLQQLGYKRIFNVAASKPIALKDIFKLRKDIEPCFVEGDLPLDNYFIDVSDLQSFYPVKTSEEYVLEYLDSLEEQNAER
jgi:nucleoside-diphosphate-sugar epimerase